MRNAPPALRTLLRGLRQVLLRAPRNHRDHRGHAQLCRLLNRPLHAIEFVHGNHQRDRQRGVGLQFGNQVEADFGGVTAATSA